MIMLIILLLALLVVVFIIGSGAYAPLVRVERLYLVTSPVPLLLTLVLPAIPVLLGVESSTRTWSLLLSAVGVWLSIGLAAVGVLLVWRNHMRIGILDRRLYAGVLLASIPALVLLLINLLFHLP